MEIRMGSLVRDAREATGTAIIIDVFRAFTTAAIAFDRGATQITLVAESATSTRPAKSARCKKLAKLE